MKRNSSIEILRILAMFLIFSGHFYGQSSISSICVEGGYGTNLLTSGSRVSVNIFMFITCYFMANPGYKVNGKKITGTYFLLWFYSVILGIVALIANKTFNYEIVKAFFPFLGGALWYMTMYIAFLLLFPFVSKINLLDRDKHKMLSIICIIIFCVYSSIHRFSEGMLAYYGWIIASYICFAYYRKYLEDKIKTKYIVLLSVVSIVGYLGLVGITTYGNGGLVSYAKYYLSEMTTLPNSFIALFIVLLATRINIGSIKWINKISGCMGAVYIAHQVEAFYPALWREICAACEGYVSNAQLMVLLPVIFVLFAIIVFFIDNIRILIWNRIDNKKVFKKMELLYDRMC